MRKYIKLQVTNQTENGVCFFVSEQTHRRHAFGEDSDRFTASSGMTLRSEYCPLVVPWDTEDPEGIFFVRGSDSSLDELPMLTSTRTFNKIAAAVRGYNKAFGSEDVIAVSYEDSANPVKEPAVVELPVYRVITERDRNDQPGSVILVIGAETYDEALEIVDKDGYTGPCMIEGIPRTTAKERGILHRSVFDQLVRRGVPRQDQNKA